MTGRASFEHVPREARAWQVTRGQLARLDDQIARAVRLEGRLQEAALHHLGTGGKRLRGRLALASSIGLGTPLEEALPIAAAVELLHNASLVHDDMQDADRERRNAPTVWARYGQGTALLLGDALIAASFGALGASRSPRVGRLVSLVAGCVGELASGQALDAALERGLPRTVDAYERIARAKTGRLFALPVELAWVHASETPTDLPAARETLELVGAAFQIHDDLADIFGAKGRAPGSDLRCGRLSAPVLHDELSRVPRPLAAAGPGPAGRLDVDVEARRLCSGPGVHGALDHQQSLVIRATRAGRTLPMGLRRVVASVADEVLDASRALVVKGRPLHRDRAAVGR